MLFELFTALKVNLSISNLIKKKKVSVLLPAVSFYKQGLVKLKLKLKTSLLRPTLTVVVFPDKFYLPVYVYIMNVCIISVTIAYVWISFFLNVTMVS